jgi:hypothetical protein
MFHTSGSAMVRSALLWRLLPVYDARADSIGYPVAGTAGATLLVTAGLSGPVGVAASGAPRPVPPPNHFHAASMSACAPTSLHVSPAQKWRT